MRAVRANRKAKAAAPDVMALFYLQGALFCAPAVILFHFMKLMAHAVLNAASRRKKIAGQARNDAVD